jgi:IS605 OrfB family transposase
MEDIIRTVKIKISNLDNNQIERILSTMYQCQDVFNYFCNLGNIYKSTSYPTLHKYGYQIIKDKYPDLPTTYIQSTAKQALSCLKAYNTQTRNKISNLQRKIYNYKKSPKKSYRIPKLEEKILILQSKIWNYQGSKSSLQLCLNKTSLSRRNDLTTFSCIGKRIKTIISIPQWFIDKYNITNKQLQSGFLKYYEKTDSFILYLIYKLQPLSKSSINTNNIIGVDRGLYNICTLSDGTNISSKKCKSIKRKYQYLRKKLQQKGTRSAKKHLKKISGREKRFMLDYNHQITKMLSNKIGVSTYVLEDLKYITEDNKSKKLNSWLSNWSYYQFETLLEYKCYYTGILIKYIDPRYTSQKCSNCGNIDKNNRQSSKYSCKCGYTDHADINAAKNIRNNYVLSLKKEQVVVNQPIVSDYVDSLDTRYHACHGIS